MKKGRQKKRIVRTIAVEDIQFLRPVRVGDEVTLYADLESVGRTSMKINVVAWRRARDSDETEKVTEAGFTFVALDESGKSRPVPNISGRV